MGTFRFSRMLALFARVFGISYYVPIHVASLSPTMRVKATTRAQRSELAGDTSIVKKEVDANTMAGYGMYTVG